MNNLTKLLNFILIAMVVFYVAWPMYLVRQAKEIDELLFDDESDTFYIHRDSLIADGGQIIFIGGAGGTLEVE